MASIPMAINPRVLVIRDCPCPRCQDENTRWWQMCTAREEVARYQLPTDEEGDVDLEYAQWLTIRADLLKAHPGCVLVC